MIELSGKFWIGATVSVLLLLVFLLTVDLGRMVDAMAGAEYVYLVPGVAMYLVSILFRALRWQVLLRHMRPIPVRRLYPVVVIGYMANNLLPMRMGELVRSYYVGEREGISKTAALATILVERVLDALTLLFFIAAIALFFPLTGLAEAFAERTGIPWPWLATAMSAPFVGAFAALVLSAYRPGALMGLTSAMVRPLPDRIEGTLMELVVLFQSGLIPLRSPRKLAALLALSAPIWLFEASLFFFVGLAFSLEDAFGSAGEMASATVLVTAIANIGSSVPAAPGGIGLFELVARETLVLMPQATVDRSVAGAFAAVVHAALLLPMIVLGQVFLWAGHLSLARVFRAGREAQAGGSVASVSVSGEGEAKP